MKDALRRICELQPSYTPDNTPAMQERGRLIRHDVADYIRRLSPSLATALGRFGEDFHVDASDGIGRKTELPWVRFCSKGMSPKPTEGYYCVLHFSTDGSAVNITIGCSSSKFQNGSFVTLDDDELDQRTLWARQVIQDSQGSLEPFTDSPDYGATRPLPLSFQRATAIVKRIGVEQLGEVDLDELLVRAARCLRHVYEAESDGRDLSPADLDELEVIQTVRPNSRTKGQGYGLSVEERKQVENRAMELVRDWLKNEGYQVKDTSSNRPYDFEAKRDGTTMKVEVKGTTSDSPNAILMTRNEVDLHRSEKGNTALFVVSSIRLVNGDDCRIATEGTLEAMLGWDIDEWALTTTAYRVERPLLPTPIERS